MQQLIHYDEYFWGFLHINERDIGTQQEQAQGLNTDVQAADPADAWLRAWMREL